MYSLKHRRQDTRYTTFSDVQVKCSRMAVELFGPRSCTLDVVSCVLASARAWVSTCGTSVWHWTKVYTRKSLSLRARRYCQYRQFTLRLPQAIFSAVR